MYNSLLCPKKGTEDMILIMNKRRFNAVVVLATFTHWPTFKQVKKIDLLNSFPLTLNPSIRSLPDKCLKPHRILALR